MAKVSEEVAREEVEKWLEYKKVTTKKREAFAEAIQTLADYICEGLLTLEEGCIFKQKLLFPLGNGGSIPELSYQPRVQIKDLSSQSKGVPNTDQKARVAAIVSSLTGVAKGIIVTMDSEDADVAQAIALFFV